MEGIDTEVRLRTLTITEVDEAERLNLSTQAIEYVRLGNPVTYAVSSITEGINTLLATNEPHGEWRLEQRGYTVPGHTYGWWVQQERLDCTPLDQSETQPEDPSVAKIKELTEALAQAKAQHDQDLALISEVLLREASDRDWCSDYDDVVDKINRQTHGSLMVREEDQEYRVYGYLRVPFSVVMSFTTQRGEYPDSEDVEERLDIDDLRESHLDWDSATIGGANTERW